MSLLDIPSDVLASMVALVEALRQQLERRQMGAS